jgi:hypothetical protein
MVPATTCGQNSRTNAVKTHERNQAGVELLERALRTARQDDDRITSDPQAAVALAQLCGGLPLALQIAAALLKADPGRSVGELAGELTDERARLEGLRYDDGSDAASSSVETAFALSYRRLDETAAWVFRVLSVNPGPDMAVASAAILADLPLGKVRRVLAGLARAHLVETAPGAARWQMHDLLRLYADRLIDSDARELARNRLLDYYMGKAAAADEHLLALPGMAVPQDFTGRADALAWFDAERPNLVAAIGVAAATGRGQIAHYLPLQLRAFFSWRRHFDDWLATGTVSLDTARLLEDLKGQAVALSSLGIALAELRRFEEAITAHQEAVAIFRDMGDRYGEGTALGNLARTLVLSSFLSS